MFADVLTATGWVETMKVAVVAFAGMASVVGTVATPVLLLLNDTIAPALGAGPVRVTVPVDGNPPVTLAGLRATDPTPRALIVIATIAVFDTWPPTLA